MLSRKLLLLVLSSPLLAQAETSNPISLCHADEQVVFSCLVNRVSYNDDDSSNGKSKRLKTTKILSLCATKPITPQSGQIWYRFGSNNKALDLIYPSNDSIYSTKFNTNIESGAHGSNQFVSFTHGGFIYTVYSKDAVYEEDARSNGGGVRVDKAGDQTQDLVVDYWCDGSKIQRTKTYIDHIYDLLLDPKGTGYPETPTFK